jgi:porin
MSATINSIGRTLIALTLVLLVQTTLATAQTAPEADSDAHEESSAKAVVATQKSFTFENFSREWLESRGVTYSVTYRAESFANLRGGSDRNFGGEYLGSVDTSISFDLKKLTFGRGRIVVSSQHLHGRSINARKVGAIQSISNLDNAGFTKVTEAYYTDAYLDDKVAIKFGRLYADADFGALANGGDFINASYGLIPTVPMPTYPAPQVGGSVWIAPLSWMSVGAGVFKGDSLAPVAEGGVETTKGVFALTEAKITPYSKTASFHGSYHVGIWRQADGAHLATATSTSSPVANYGVYATGDHWFHKPNSAGENVGPGIFFQLGASPSDRNEVNRFVGGGVAWPGMIPQRSYDSVGVGITRATLAATDKSETVTELFYKFQATKKLYIQPDLQWVNKPAGVGANALLGGFRIGYEF